jgi:hypothetical protein
MSLIVSLSILFLTGGLLAQESADSGTGHVKREELHFDFGFMPDQAAVTHKFWIVNRESDSIMVEKIKPGCGCLTAPLPAGAIAPGDSVAIPITFKSGIFRNYIEKKTRVTTRSLETDAARVTLLTIIGYVAPDSMIARLLPLHFDPPRLQINTGGKQVVYTIHSIIGMYNCQYSLLDQYPDFVLEPLTESATPIFRLRQPLDTACISQSASATIKVECDSSYNITIPIEFAD